MLKLGRKQGETIFVGEDIKVTIVQIKRKSVIVGIDAPDDVCILREEVPMLDEDEE